MKKRTNENFIEECKMVHGDNFTYEKTEYKNCRTKVTVTKSVTATHTGRGRRT